MVVVLHIAAEAIPEAVVLDAVRLPLHLPQAVAVQQGLQPGQILFPQVHGGPCPDFLQQSPGDVSFHSIPPHNSPASHWASGR